MSYGPFAHGYSGVKDMGLLSRLKGFFASIRTKLSPKEWKESQKIVKDVAKVLQAPPKPPEPQKPSIPSPPPEGITIAPIEQRITVEPIAPSEEVWELEIEYSARWGHDKEQYYRLPQHYKVRYSVDYPEEHDIVKLQSLDAIRTMNKGVWNERVILRRV